MSHSRADGGSPFVPADFVVPDGLLRPEFSLVPLGPEHNERDYAAWTSSVDHIRGTPGYATHDWPHPMEPADNLGDLVRHAEDFERRTGFTYSVLDGDDVIGCVYIYPGDAAGAARVRSWVRADRAALDVVLYRAVTDWLRRDWPFTAWDYAPRV
jgi:hypothetical protein